MSAPLRQKFPFDVWENTITVPITIPEDNNLWTVVSDIQKTDTPPGFYIVSGGITWTPTSTAKSTLFRQVDKGAAGTAISLESKDASDVDYLPFRTYVIVDTDGIIDFQIEAQCEEGQGGDGVDVLYTLLDTELKIEQADPGFASQIARLTGSPFKVLTK